MPKDEPIVGFDKISEVLRRMNEDYTKLNPPDFITHFNYIKYLATLSKNISIIYKPTIKNKISKSRNLDKKLTLIRLTLENIQREYETIQKTPDFAPVYVSWIAVKSYYLVYNLSMILRYLITCDEKSFYCSHTQLLHEIIEYLDRGEIIFSEAKFTKIHKGKTIRDWKAPNNNNVRLDYDPNILYLQIIKKLQEYKEEDYKRRNNIPNIRKKFTKIRYCILDKTQKSDYLSSFIGTESKQIIVT